MDDELTVDHIVTGDVAASLGPGVIPVSAVLVIETMSADGAGIRWVRSAGCTSWQTLGLLRSATIRCEIEDRAGWLPDDEEEP